MYNCRTNEKQEVRPSLFTRKVLFSSAVRKPLVVGFALLFFQQFSGIDAVIFFTVEIFQKAGNYTLGSIVLFSMSLEISDVANALRGNLHVENRARILTLLFNKLIFHHDSEVN